MRSIYSLKKLFIYSFKYRFPTLKLLFILQTKCKTNLSAAQYMDGNDVTKLASMAKLKGGRLVREVSDSCLQYWGGMGFTNEVKISRFYRYVYFDIHL